MKTTFNTAVKAGLFAVSLAFAGSSHAAGTPTYTLADFTDKTHEDSSMLSMGAKSFDFSEFIVPPTFLATNASADYSMLAFCIEPTTPTQPNAVYTLGSVTSPLINADIRANVNKLFAAGYSGIGAVGSAGMLQRYVSFQLALWDLTSDVDVHGNGASMYSGANQYFTDLTDADAYTVGAVQGAQALISAVYANHGTVNYTLFQMTSQGSQTMLAAPVPEADTWAMLAAGLGLLGLVSRRKNSKNEKFV